MTDRMDEIRKKHNAREGSPPATWWTISAPDTMHRHIAYLLKEVERSQADLDQALNDIKEVGE